MIVTLETERLIIRNVVPEAIKAIIDHVAALNGGIHVYGRFCKRNPKSGRVMTKLGMKYVCDTTYSKIDGSEIFESYQYEGDFK